MVEPQAGEGRAKFTFVGRDKEFEQLKGYLEKTIQGQGNTVFIAGEAGIGKTRLVEELRNVAVDNNCNFLIGRCLYRADSDPFLPFVDALRRYFNIKTGDDNTTEKKKIKDTIRKSSPELVQMIPVVGNIISAGVSLYIHSKGEKKEETIDPEQEKNRMFETLNQLLVSISKKQPLVLFLDDLHWADDTSLSLLHYISRTAKEVPLLILGTYRPEDLDESGKKGLAEVKKRMSREYLFEEVPLKRLSEQDIEEMVDKTFGVTAPMEFIHKIFKQSDGNPFFAGEILLSLEDDNIIDFSTGKWPENLKVEDIEIPSRVEDVIARRINKIDNEEEVKALTYAAVAGEVFRFDLLPAVTKKDEIEIIEMLEDAMNRNLLYELKGEGKFRFNHALIKDYLYNSISDIRLRLMCKQLGEALEQLEPDVDDVAAELASYFMRAGVDDKSLKYSIIAGDLASKKFAHYEAVYQYKNALDLIKESDKVQKIKLYDEIGDEYYVAGDYDEAIDYYNNSLKLKETLDETPKSLSETYRNIGNIRREQLKFNEAIEYLKKSLEIATKFNDETNNAEAHFGLGETYFRLVDYNKAISCYKAALEHVSKLGNVGEIGKAAIGIGYIYLHAGEFQKATEYYEQSIAALEKDYYWLSRAYHFKGDILNHEEKYDEALEYYFKSVEIAKKYGFLKWRSWGIGDIGEVYALIGQTKKAREYLDLAVKLYQKCNEKGGPCATGMRYGIVYTKEKNWEKAIESFNNSIECWKIYKYDYLMAFTYYHFGLMYKEMRNKKEAKEKFGKALEIYENLKSEYYNRKISKEIKELTKQI